MMPRLSKKYKIILITASAILGIILLCRLPFVVFFNLNPSKISYGTLHFDKNKEKLYLSDILLWDTGASESMLFESCGDKIQYRKIPFYYMLISDVFNKKRFQSLFYSLKFNITDSLYINNFYFLMLKDPIEELKFHNKDEIGIIGMDIINEANWLIDFDSEKIEISSKDKIYKSEEQVQLTFNYKKTNTPITFLDFSIFQIENVLIDAGHNCEITLFKSDIEQINKKYTPIDTLTFAVYGIHSSEPTIQCCYVYDTIMINNLCFNNVEIIEGTAKRIIGFKFFKRFNKVCLNTKEKEFRFY